MKFSARLRRLALGVFAASVASAAPAVAVAHPLVDDGLEHLRAADFRAASDAFDRAESATDLTLADVLTLLEGRAMAAQATGDEAAVALNLGRLAALEPDHRFGAEAPPEIRAAFERARHARERPLSLEVRSSREAGAVVLEAVVQGDPGGLVRSVELSARPAGGAWRTWQEPRARIPVDAAQVVEAHASARGPGGAVVAQAGRPEAPLRIAPTPVATDEGRAGGAAGGAGRGRDRSDDHGSAGTWAWIGAGTAIVVAAVVLAAVATSSSGPSDTTHLHSPELP